MAVPVAALVTRQFSAQGRVEDSTRAYYAAEAGILAVAEDLSRGADAAPRPPYDYIPPTVNVDDLVPAISVEPSSFQVLDAIKPVYYTVEGEPTILVAANVVGDGSDLTEDDENDYTLTSTGDPPSLSYEVTSEVIGLDAVSRVRSRSSPRPTMTTTGSSCLSTTRTIRRIPAMATARRRTAP